MMFETLNDLPLPARKKVTDVLSALLADAADLYSQAKQAHWNVRGPSFIALHELFDKVAATISQAADDIAERILQLGGEASGTVRAAAKASRLKEYPLRRGSGEQHVEALSRALGSFVRLSRKAIEEADEAGDMVTADLLTQITTNLDKHLWFVEAHQPEEMRNARVKTG